MAALDTNAAERVTRFERHLGTIVQVVVAGLLMWVGNSLLGLREDVAVIKAEVPQIMNQIPSIQSQVTGLTSRISVVEQRLKDAQNAH